MKLGVEGNFLQYASVLGRVSPTEELVREQVYGCEDLEKPAVCTPRHRKEHDHLPPSALCAPAPSRHKPRARESTRFRREARLPSCPLRGIS